MLLFCCISLTRVDLDGTNISDEGVRKLVEGSPRLEWIGLARCKKITVRSLEHVAANLHHLAGIDLCVDLVLAELGGLEKFPVDSSGVRQLMTLRSLRHIVLSATQWKLRRFVA